jgi:hypothetical protein
MIEVSMVPVGYIDSCWDRVEPHMEKAAEYTFGRYTVDDIYDSVKEHDYQLWVAFDGDTILGAVVTQIMTYPRLKALNMIFCGGEDLEKWKTPMLELLQRFGADKSCDCIESTGRRGWAKVFAGDGYKERWVIYELPVKGEDNG